MHAPKPPTTKPPYHDEARGREPRVARTPLDEADEDREVQGTQVEEPSGSLDPRLGRSPVPRGCAKHPLGVLVKMIAPSGAMGPYAFGKAAALSMQ